MATQEELRRHIVENWDGWSEEDLDRIGGEVPQEVLLLTLARHPLTKREEARAATLTPTIIRDQS